MQQYSPKNQIFLTAQAAMRGMPQPTDVRSCKAWNAAGRSIIKGEKALRVWIPKRGKAIPADLSTMTEAQEREYFVRGPVFDISQTQPTKPNAKRQREQQSILSEHRHEQAWTDYAAAIDAGDIPADLDFADWYELREDSIRVAAGCSSNVGASDYADYTIATNTGAIIAQVEHHDIYAPIGGGSQELDTIAQETAPAVSEPHQHEAYKRGIEAGNHAYRTLDISLIHAMHTALVEQLSPPPSYPSGIAGLDYAYRLGRLHAYSYLLNADPDPHPACFHAKRRYNISTVTSAEELAGKLTGLSWCLCQGWELGHALFLNDATHEDGAAEYAVIDTRTMKQIESITFSWCKPDKALAYIEAAAAGTMECPWPMGILDPHRLDYNKPYPHCAHCR